MEKVVVPFWDMRYRLRGAKSFTRWLMSRPLFGMFVDTPDDPNIPDFETEYRYVIYPNEIMYLSKVMAKPYRNVAEWYDDMVLMVKNCETFNGERHPITIIARHLEMKVDKFYTVARYDAYEYFLRRSDELERKQARTYLAIGRWGIRRTRAVLAQMASGMTREEATAELDEEEARPIVYREYHPPRATTGTGQRAGTMAPAVTPPEKHPSRSQSPADVPQRPEEWTPKRAASGAPKPSTLVSAKQTKAGTPILAASNAPKAIGGGPSKGASGSDGATTSEAGGRSELPQ
jgi:hypothetical protein